MLNRFFNNEIDASELIAEVREMGCEIQYDDDTLRCEGSAAGDRGCACPTKALGWQWLKQAHSMNGTAVLGLARVAALSHTHMLYTVCREASAPEGSSSFDFGVSGHSGVGCW